MRIMSCTPLRNAEFFSYLFREIKNSTTRVWISMFTINSRIQDDSEMAVRTLIKEIQKALHRGVDVRVILGASEKSYTQLQIVNQTSLNFLKSLGIPTKNYSVTKNKDSHSKYVIVDDDIIIQGSHNLSSRSLSVGIDDSIAMQSPEMNLSFRKTFLESWEES